MEDFSKIDIWALAILLINMITLDFPFFRWDDKADYEKFISDPKAFFNKHQVEFSDL